MSDGTLNDVDTYRHNGAPTDEPIGGTSVFDPVLCELVYRWFCQPGGSVIDPFAGGSVRGIVAGELGLHYTGVDLSERQLDANRIQAEAIGTSPTPQWVHGDSVLIQQLVEGPCDLLFSCPPYLSLERYSDDPRDLSTLSVAEFNNKYRVIIHEACQLIKDQGFACFVVGDYREKDGFYANLPATTIRAFESAGLRLYNQAILVNAVGSLSLRINNQFIGSRKLGTCHQQILVFAKGQPREFVKSWDNSLMGQLNES